MGQALYRKYRSRSFDEVVGQEHITTTLKNALKSGKISHAYLFTGPKGVGKTSIARILAYEVNGLPYSDDSQQHLDIIEIDAASNRRVDEIRELRDKVHVAPTNAKYKVYIIDEVHMLTKEAFNALLKTLEEPPAHVIFILATTEVHKLPETIISRTQRFTFRPIDAQQAVAHLKKLAKTEGITIDDASLALIAEHGGGSFRDSISLLDQMSSSAEAVNLDIVHQTIGLPPENAIQNLLRALSDKRAPEVLSELEALYLQGFQAPQIAKQLMRQLSSDAGSPTDFGLLRQLLETPMSHDPKTYLELVLMEAALHEGVGTASAPRQPITTEDGSAEAPDQPQPQPVKQPTPSKPDSLKKTAKASPGGDLWSQTLDELKGRHNTLYGIVRMAEATQSGDTLTLTFGFPFHQRRCNEARNRERIEAILEQLSGKTTTIECVVGKVKPGASPEPTKHKPKKTEKSDTLGSITEVFGGGEILE